MRISTRRGMTRLRFDPVEAGVLTSVLDDMSVVLEELEPDDPVRARLFPAGYLDDDDAASDFRQLTESGLLTERRDRIGQCRAELTSGAEISVDAEGLQRWMMALNDVRLTLGTRLDVREEEEPKFDPEDPESQPWQIYYWLTALQDRLVTEAGK